MICHKPFTERLHTSDEPFKCDVCYKHFLERLHNGEKPFKCDVCHKHFAERLHTVWKCMKVPESARRCLKVSEIA